MKPVLLDLSQLSPLTSLLIFVVLAVAVGVWLAVLRQRRSYTTEHLTTGVILLAMGGIFLFLINRIGHFRINAYGAMLMVGFVLGMVSAVRLGRRRGVSAENLLDLGLLILICAVVGARLMYWAITKDAGPLFDLRDVLNNGLGGLSFHGGLLGGLIACVIYVRVKKLNFLHVADTVAPGIAIGYAITRIGCFLNGCCYGRETEMPWAVVFPNLHDHIPRHPSQIYASLMGLTMFGVLLLLSRGKSLGRTGRLLMAFLMLEGVERFVMEIFRQPDPGFHGGLTSAQVLSIVLILGGIVGWFTLPKRAAVLDQPETEIAPATVVTK